MGVLSYTSYIACSDIKHRVDTGVKWRERLGERLGEGEVGEDADIFNIERVFGLDIDDRRR